MDTRIYTILWGHSGRKGREYHTAREAARCASSVWGEVEATSVDEALTIIEREGHPVKDYYHDGAENIHVIFEEN